MTFRSPRLSAALTVGSTLIAVLSGCGSSDNSPPAHAQPTVVASTNVWGSVASAIAGPDALVTSILSDPAADPHSYESKPSDVVLFDQADLVIVNGGDYDPWAEKAVSGVKDKPVINAFDTYKADTAPGSGTEVNEHLWYDLPTADRVADKIASELGRIDPSHRDSYTNRAETFHRNVQHIE